MRALLPILRYKIHRPAKGPAQPLCRHPLLRRIVGCAEGLDHMPSLEMYTR